ncbi:related to Phosphatidylinositol 4-kinase PIK1 [Saccharomycodes ludwigii]|uniref:1-phosphatidylinositol 4-kinase n=1 Tax=Saccharomycodes ludwigii TaxID=36035 RepID=A0A376B150_9ASCO|nr:related to Phosphatidylinositol 4-kinase PIK1 [Saccharomycodes ludwigii]
MSTTESTKEQGSQRHGIPISASTPVLSTLVEKDGSPFDISVYKDNTKKGLNFKKNTRGQQNNQLLFKFINSSHFSLYTNIEYLIQYSDNIGIHYYLCQKLLTFPHYELQFYIPQLVQILLTIETESIALEHLILKLSNENPHFALLTFWQLQALLGDLSADPKSFGFEVARRTLNKLQHLLLDFSKNDYSDILEPKKLRENTYPAMLLSSMLGLSIGLPQLSEYAKPLIVSQGAREKSYVFTVAKNALRKLNKNLTMKNTKLNSANTKSNTTKIILQDGVVTKDDLEFKKPLVKSPLKNAASFEMVDIIGTRLFDQTISSAIKLPKRRDTMKNTKNDKLFVHRKENSNDSGTNASNTTKSGDILLSEDPRYVNSMPNLLEHNRSSTSVSTFNSADELRSTKSSQDIKSKPKLQKMPSEPPLFHNRRISSHHGANFINIDPNQISMTKKIKLLKMNYFRCETQFVIALESISQRLSKVPKDARLTALRAELALMNRDLPAEVDIPTLLPPNKKGKLHKLVKIECNEAQVLNSAEKVPFLLLIEYLRDELDFDPSTEANEELLNETPQEGSFIFDLTNIKNDKRTYDEDSTNNKTDKDTKDMSIFVDRKNSFSQMAPSPSSSVSRREIDLGDISMVHIEKQSQSEHFKHELSLVLAENVPVLSSDTRTPELHFISNIDDLNKISNGNSGGNGSNLNLNAGSLDDLATQMRISAVMLAQLDKSPYKLQDSANQIRKKIIESMQEVQDRFGFKDFESITNGAGERRLENDLKTGGLLSSKPDVSYLGEDWNAKKERIRKTSKFGHMDNWDLCSVIAKSGDDLRQEAFACQLIQAMANIWQDENVDVWVKKMKILITSPTTGLVETITNSMSVHSIKKSLTKLMIESGELNEKAGEIASLAEHFLRAYGDPKGFKYKRAQDNFASSLAAYSVICYILQIKDRHNGNIMIDNEGHMVHIDFGFMLSNSPGSVGFEAAPFKLTLEYVDILGGLDAEPFKKYVRLVKEAFKALRKHANVIVSMCEIMQKESLQPCFNAGSQTSIQLEQRFYLSMSDEECDKFVEDYLISKSLGSIYTRLYDQFQLITQGIYS